ncbi:hypothetical protein ACJX0J_030325, partial [Zea mays]
LIPHLCLFCFYVAVDRIKHDYHLKIIILHRQVFVSDNIVSFIFSVETIQSQKICKKDK